MKFYGIDCQGYMKMELMSGTLDAFVGGQDERRLIYLDTGTEDRIYLGGDTANNWARVVMDDGATYSSLTTQLEGNFHPLGGSDTDTFKSITYSAVTGQNTIDLAADWVYVSTDRPVDTTDAGATPPYVPRWGGLMVEVGTPGDNDNNAVIYYDGSIGTDPNTMGWEWRLQGPNYSDSGGPTNGQQIIATREWVDSNTGTELGTYFNKTDADLRFVRYADQGDASVNTTWQEWKELTDDTIGTPAGYTGTNNRVILQKNEIYHSYVRVSAAITEDNPILSGGGLRVETSNATTASTVVFRNASQDIYARYFRGIATSALYADLAEVYTCDEETPIGTVMEVDLISDDEVVPCMFELSPSVVGVVSENPAFIMNDGGDGLPIALTGKVPVRMVGEVRKGDFIVPAGGGLARKGEPSEIGFKMGISLDTDLHIDEKLVECIIK
jgi:hypothetical protein